MNTDLESALCRRNAHPAALGNIRRFRLFRGRFTMYMSPDACMWLVPTGITLGLLAGTATMTFDTAPIYERVLLIALIITALTASLAVTCTDPGIYPRLAPGETDPLAQAGPGYNHCRVCNVRRPPRAAHCYVCNVCVLEHDHHCGVIGGCVGIRSLRWFTLYLVSVSSASLVGCVWLLFDVMGTRLHEQKELPTAAPTRPARRQHHSTESLSAAIDIMLMVFIFNVVLVVGGLGVYYVYLMCKDTTRREAQGKLVRTAGPSSGALGHLRKTLFPPSSMLEAEIPEDCAPRGSIV